MKKVIKKAKRKAVPSRKRYSPRQQQVIQDLAEMLGKLLPATSRSPFCLQKIAKNKGLSKYFLEGQSKKKQFTHFISAVHKAHPKTLKRLINDILADCIIRCRSQGNPWLRPEADLFKEKLLEFGIDLRKEIDELELPITRPAITPPNPVILQSLQGIGLHKTLLSDVIPLFKDGYMNESVRKAGEITETEIMRWSGVHGQFGRNLMAQVFNKDTPLIDVSRYHGSAIANPMDEKEGFMLVAMGAMQWCKNIVGHGNVDQLPPHEAASRIIMLSHLLEVVDKTVAKKQAESQAQPE
ncbi:MAG: TIGR02391 family protein [Candidatus Paceibacterota bacterium]